MEERLIRKVTEIGNGAHIFAPREWLDEEVVIIRIPKKDPKEEIIKLLRPYLDKVIASFLYGSYARNEQEKDSDIDIFVISSEKLIIKAKGIEIMVIPEDKIEMAKKLNPVLFYSALQEAHPIINSSYIGNLRKEKIKLSYFKDFIKETKIAISSNEELVNLDKKTGKEVSASVVYSLVLRLRGVFIISNLLNRKEYSKKEFKDWLDSNSINYNTVYNVYRALKNNKKPEEKILIQEIEPLMKLLANEIKKLERRT